jgi:putative ABC transport system permease protein
VDVGFDPSNLLTFQVTTSGVQNADEQRTFAETFIDRLRMLPGVESAAYARQLPLVQLQDAITLTIRHDGIDTLLGEAPDIRFVSRDYLNTIGAKIVGGRGFGESDRAGHPGVVIVNEAFARREFTGQNPVGQTVYFLPQRQMALEIIGVVADIRQFGLDQAPEPQYFMDIRQIPTDPVFRTPPLFPLGAYYTVRTSVEKGKLLDRIRTAVRQLDTHATLDNVASMEQIVSNSITRPSMYATLVAIFAAVAVSLAAVGLYGVMAYAVAQRTREIGIRIALGATRRGVLKLVLRHGAAMALPGLVIGLCGAVAATRSLEGMLFGLTPLDPTAYVLAALMLSCVAASASYIPARHAINVDPIVALRTE